MTNWTDQTMIQKMGVAALTSSADDVAEFEIGQLLLDVNNGRIYAIRSENTTTNSDRIYFWGADGSISLSFSASSFSDNQSSSQLIGSGAWKAGTALTFTAAYENGPATSANISCGSWSSNLVLSTPFTSGTGSSTAQDAAYPAAVGNSITFQLNAAKSSESDTRTTSVSFYNERCNGLSTTSSGYDSADINGLSSKVVTSGKNGTFSFSPTAGDYIIIAYRTALGTSTFTVGGFEGGFESPETVSRTNSAGFTENYYVYRSSNHSLADPTSVVVT